MEDKDNSTVKVLKSILAELKQVRESIEAQQKRLTDHDKEAAEVAALFTRPRSR